MDLSGDILTPFYLTGFLLAGRKKPEWTMNFAEAPRGVAGFPIVPDNRCHIRAHGGIGQKVTVPDDPLPALDGDKIRKVRKMRRKSHVVRIDMRIEPPEAQPASVKHLGHAKRAVSVRRVNREMQLSGIENYGRRSFCAIEQIRDPKAERIIWKKRHQGPCRVRRG